MWRELRSALHGRAGGDTGCAEAAAVQSALLHMATLLVGRGFAASVHEVLAQCATLLGGDRCYLVFRASDGETRMWRRDPEAQPGASQPALSFDDLPEFDPQGRASCVQLACGADASAVNDGEADPRAAGGLQSALAAPLVDGDELLGWLVVETTREGRQFSAGECSLASAVAQLLAAGARRQQQWDELGRLALAVEQSPATVIITDPEGVIEYVNPRFSESSGYGADEAIGKVFRMPSDTTVAPEAYGQLREALVGGAPWHGELPNRRKDGTPYWEAVAVSPIRTADGRISYVMAVKEDISEQRRFQEQLERAKDEAELANRAKSEFLANMSHEIRTPVNAILGNAHLALQTELSDRQRDHLTRIHAASRSLLGIISSILDFSTIDAGLMTIDSFDFRLEDVLDNLRDLLAAKARAKGLRLSFSIADKLPGALVGDPFRLGQVLINLGDNAVKFTAEGEVELVVSEEEQSPQHVRLRFIVRDSGVGIAGDQLVSIFQPFTQGDGSTTRPFGGTGLGLTVAQRLVEMMGGRIEVSSEPGAGSSFSFSISFRRQFQPGSLRAAPSRELKGMRVLVVDDSMASRSVLSETLEGFTFFPEAVASGEAALELLCSAEADMAPFRVVLMDWKMPTMDGIEAARRIKNHPHLVDPPAVILITGYGREDIMQQADKAMLDGFLLKPVNPSLLFDTIMAAIGHGGRGAGESSEQVAAAPAQQPSRGSVLVVEDNLLNQEVASELLSDMGLVVEIADNGLEALQALREAPVDLILMDVQMPVMDGYAATAAIRAVPELARIPIVAMTAHAMSGDRERCLAAGMNDYISKPIDHERLREILGEWLVLDGGQPRAAPDQAAAEQEPPLQVALPGLNTEAGLARIGGKQTLYRKLLRDFLHDFRTVHGTIGTALQLGHLESALRLLHTLKGVAATIGAEGVHVAARELEASVAGGDQVRSKQMLEQLGRSLGPLLEGIAVLEESGTGPVAALGHGKRQDADLAAAAPLLRELEELLREGDPDAAGAFDALQVMVGGHRALAATLDTLGEQIESFDFDDGVSTLERLGELLGLAVRELSHE